MIYTVTFNPALDYIMRFDSIRSGNINRAKGEEIFIGGKGINISVILNELGLESTALGFIAGFTGDILSMELSALGIKTDFVKLEGGFSRINVKVKSDTETELNAHGPVIGESALNLLFEKLSPLRDGDTLILAGSIPDTLSDDIYERILSFLSGKGIRFVVDATGRLLMNVLKYKPFLVKPNNTELGEMFGTEIKSESEVETYAGKLQEMGAKNVLVSLSGDGAFLIDEDGGTHRLSVAKGKVINSVGAGDSMVAGFLAGYMQTGDYGYALKLGSAAGGATAFTSWLAKKEEIMAHLSDF